MSGPVLPCEERVIGAAPRLSVIWLHGLGADGHDFEPIVDALELSGGYRFVFPHAPVRPVTINGGYRMRAWFDIFSLNGPGREDDAGIAASASAVTALVDREIELGTPSRRIVLAGFSQGGAMALQVALREPRPLAGLLALSAFLPRAAALAAEKSAANAQIPVFMAHGVADPVIRLEFAEASRRRLEAEGYRVEWKTYSMAHEVSPAEVRDVARWLEARHADAGL
ncbi:MAG TPA: alpha/beta fold hydrolase [Gammaproteobacteria bacterium]|nr:alpha/beta fold hydrolase [Gammaproteobacteria bacterium]